MKRTIISRVVEVTKATVVVSLEEAKRLDEGDEDLAYDLLMHAVANEQATIEVEASSNTIEVGR